MIPSILRLIRSARDKFAPPCPLMLEFTRYAEQYAADLRRHDLGRDVERAVKYRVRRVRDGANKDKQRLLLGLDIQRLVPSAEIARVRMGCASCTK
jgi:hypothetical protein